MALLVCTTHAPAIRLQCGGLALHFDISKIIMI